MINGNSLSKINFRSLTLLLCLIAFSGVTNAATKENKAFLKTINLQLKWLHQFQFAGYYMAKEKGYYSESGLNVNFIESTQGPSPIEKLSYGTVDYAIGGAGAVSYFANGMPLVALATFFQHSPSLLISRFPTLSSLKNKKVMLTKGLMNSEIIAMLRKNNINPEQMNIIPTSQALSEFIDGEIDGYNIYASNEIYALKKMGINYHSFHPKDYDINFYGDVLLTLSSRIKSNPEEVAKFRNATVKGWRYAISNIEESIDVILKKYNSQGKTKDELTFEAEQLMPLIYADIIPLGYMNIERWQAIEKELITLGSLQGPPVDLTPFIYTSPEELGIWQKILSLKKYILLTFIILSIAALLLHNRRLKVKVREHTQLLEYQRVQAEKDARTDSLTQLANRRKFMETIDHDLSIASRNSFELSIIYIDIDHFKTINDSYGHAAGDKVLMILADIFRENTRPSDSIARIGGEEFAITSLGKNTNDAVTLANRIRKKVEDYLFTVEGKTIKVTISLGVATLIEAQTSDELLKRTDDALYKAKNLGRNQVQVA